MGMFDYIGIDNKWIPENRRKDYDKQDYQTKDLSCDLNNYDILDDGRLMLTQTLDEGELFKPVVYTGQISFYDDNSRFIAWCVNGTVKEVIDVTIGESNI